jgi:four helix bundle protein
MIEIIKQLVRAAGSIGANYIEANEAVSQKDFLLHARIARKEAKEERHWLGLLDVGEVHSSERDRLLDEATQLLKILSAIIKKSEE